MKIGKHDLYSNIILPDDFEDFIIFLAGGGNKTFSETSYPTIQNILKDYSVASVSFDYRGISDSVKLEDTNLNTRLEDAIEIYDYISENFPKRNIYVSGKSMGGPVAINLCNLKKCSGIILIAPAAYTKSANSKNFGLDFKECISVVDSYKDSESFAMFKDLKIKKMLIYGNKDTIIPIEILKSYETTGLNLNRKDILVIFDECDHSLKGKDVELVNAIRKFLIN